MRRKLVFLLPVLLLLVLSVSCARKDLSPYEADTDHDAADMSTAVLNLDVTGRLIDDNVAVGTEKDDPTSWITIMFSNNMEGGNVDVHVYEYTKSGIDDEVEFTKEWDHGSFGSVLLLKPADDLDYNKNYVLKINASGTFDRYGKKLDKDGDEVGGETPDDDYLFYFVTRKSDGSDGDAIPWIEDTLTPVVSSGVRSTDGSNTFTTLYFDYRICIKIEDRTYDTTGAIIDTFIDDETVNENTVKVLDYYTGEEVSGSVTYNEDNSSSLNRYVIFKPDDDFQPDHRYILRLYADIKDEAGNKLWETDPYIDYIFTTSDQDHNGDTLEIDFRPPYIVDYQRDGVYGKIYFSEPIDHNTVGPATIYATSGMQLTYQVGEVMYNGKLVSVVFVSRVDGNNIAGTTVRITGAIKDLAGNLKGCLNTHTF
ncbi:Ig-like domain-containing protein [candidate division WOR-3 bacterium]|nr:Ig-like domain-containing protein [candidate division WOR-3 bacterium]